MKHIFRTTRVLLAIITAAAIIGCSPRFKTYYDFTPPASFAGRECVNACQGPLQQCEANQQYEFQNCETRAENSYQRCESGKELAPDPVRGWDSPRCIRNCDCSRDYCPEPDLELCQGRYRECYRNCGGTVTGTTTCVANCEKVKSDR